MLSTGAHRLYKGSGLNELVHVVVDPRLLTRVQSTKYQRLMQSPLEGMLVGPIPKPEVHIIQFFFPIVIDFLLLVIL